jgi:hypothetical protein
MCEECRREARRRARLERESAAGIEHPDPDAVEAEILKGITRDYTLWQRFVLRFANIKLGPLCICWAYAPKILGHSTWGSDISSHGLEVCWGRNFERLLLGLWWVGRLRWKVGPWGDYR